MLFSEILDFVVTHRNKGRSGSFNFPDEVLVSYIVWAFQRDYITLTYGDNGITSIIIVAPLNKDFNPDQDKLFAFDRFIPINEEKDHPLGVLDFICIDNTKHKEIIGKLLARFENFVHQEKWAVRFDKTVKLPNKYFNHFYHL